MFRNLSAINRRRLDLFKANRRGYVAFMIFSVLFLMSVFAPLIANDRPILASYKGELLYPAVQGLSRKHVRRLPRQDGFPRPGQPG